MANYGDFFTTTTNTVPSGEPPLTIERLLEAKRRLDLDRALLLAEMRAFGIIDPDSMVRSPYDNGKVIDGECQRVSDAPQLPKPE